MATKKQYILTGIIGLLLGVGAWYFIKRGKKVKEVIKENNAEIVITE